MMNETVRSEVKPWLRKLPNQLTWLRIILIPAIVVLMLSCEDYVAGEKYLPTWMDISAAIIFAIAAMTDFFDGWLARKFHIETVTGKLLDPLADKLLVISALIILVAQHKLYTWLVVVLIVRDLGINAIRNSALEDGVVISSSWLGKTKTFFMDFGIIFLIYNQHDASWLSWRNAGLALMFVALMVSLYSGYEYLRDYAKCISNRS